MKTFILTLFSVLSLSLHAQDYSKLSGYLRQLAHERNLQVTTRGADVESPRMVMLVRGEEHELAPYCLTHQGDLHLCRLTLDEALSLSQKAGVKRIQATKSQMSVSLDTLTQITNVDQLWDGSRLPQAYTGKGVLLGVPDAGIEYSHPVFRDEHDGHLRIVRAWDKTDLSRSEAYDAGSVFPIGTLHTSEADILAKGQSADSRLISHGTSTTSVAAGVPAGTPYRGVAYDADIYSVTELVSGNQDAVDEQFHSYYTDELVLLSYSNIFAYADSVGQPCVISTSLGGMQDMTDADIMTNEYIERLLTPGHLLVASAGNNGKQARYMYKPVGVASVGSGLVSGEDFAVINISTTGDLTLRLAQWIEGEYVSHDIKLDMAIGDSVSASGLRWYDFAPLDTLAQLNDMQVAIYSGYDGFDSTRVGYDIFLYFADKGESLTVEVIGQQSEADIFVQRGEFLDSKSDSATLADAEACLGNVLSPSALPAVIAVGSTSHRTSVKRHNGSNYQYLLPSPRGERAEFSSCGPSLHRFIKPDIVAPGVAVVSALNSVYYANNESQISSRIVSKHAPDGEHEYQWVVDCGTSYSTPIVGGILALWLQADPTLTQDRVKEILAKTCRQDDSMLTLESSEPGVWPNNECGYGEIDAYRGLLEVLQLPDHIPALSTQPLQQARVLAADDGQLTLSFDEPLTEPCHCAVYGLDGQLLCRQSLQSGEQKISLPLPAYQGVVVVQVEGVGSMLVRV